MSAADNRNQSREQGGDYSLFLSLLLTSLLEFFLKCSLYLFHRHWFFACKMSVVKVSDYSGIGGIASCELPCGCWELKPCPLEEQSSDLNYRILFPAGLIWNLR